MRANSLSLRLVISSAAWTLMILSVTAAILISLCRDFLEESFDQRLNQYLENIIAKATPQGTLDIRKPDDIGEPLFFRPLLRRLLANKTCRSGKRAGPQIRIAGG